MHGTLGEVVGDAPVTVLDVFPVARPLPDTVRASLEAIRVAQSAARERARREMWQARAVVGGVAAAVALGGILVWPHLRAGKTARAASAATAAVHPRQPPAPSEQRDPATMLAPGGLLAAGVAGRAAMNEAAAVAPPGAALFDACRDSYAGKRWRAAAAACATAFTAQPDDAKLALRVAEAEYARDHLPEAREWAQRTLTLDPKQADALAILGRSEQRTGHGEAAARAFRGYLALAPHGWHAPEARAALRGAHPSARRAVSAAATTATPGQPRDEDAPLPPTPTTEPAATAPAAFSVSAPGVTP